ncbi:MAG: hypothetical protein M5U01_28730 [Ardenticatenaceae bacterium]|nr:hypothetical protein [Ardenticatenaceae bacterium]
MLFVVIGDAKPDVTLEQIRANRRAFLVWERESGLGDRCQTLARYEVVGQSPKRTFWIMRADDPQVIHDLLEFFGDVWNVQAFPVIERSLVDVTRAVTVRSD